MALIKIQRELFQIADRCDRRGKHELAEKIRGTIEELRWAGFNSKITHALNELLESKRSYTFEKILPKLALLSGYSMDELVKFPHIQEYFDYAKQVAKRRAAQERELQRRLMLKL